jgi:dephospho-CoA kinase
MNKQIFVINGSGGNGKDTFVEMCSKYYPIMNISSVDNVKKAAQILGWNGGKEEVDRLFLSNMKLLSTRYNNNPLEYIKRNINYFLREDTPYLLMFIHIREPKEIDKVKELYDCKTLLVKNSNVKEITTNMADANVLNYNYDYEIDNSGTLEDLENKAKEFLKKLEV